MQLRQNYKIQMVDRRRSPDFSQITGYVPKSLATEFKVACTRLEVSHSDIMETLIAQWLQDLETKRDILSEYDQSNS